MLLLIFLLVDNGEDSADGSCLVSGCLNFGEVAELR